MSSPYDSPSATSSGSMVSEYAFAGFWKRFIAYIIDAILFSLAFALIISMLGGSIFSFNSESPTAFGAAGIYLMDYPAWWLYFALMESSNSQGTIGKKIMGIKVTDREGQPVRFAQATGRHFSAVISQMIFSIGYLMAAFTARKQALHDMVAGTLVVNSRYGPAQVKVANESPGTGMSVGSIIAVVLLVLIIPVGGILAAIAIPAYQDYTIRSRVVEAITETKPVQLSITEYAATSGYWPNTLQQAGITQAQLSTNNYQILLAGNGSYQIIFKQPEILSESRITFTPQLNNSGGYEWQCNSTDLKESQLPPECR